jgi:cytochrome c553
MPISRVRIAILLLVLIPIEAGSRDAQAIWDSRCEECHGDPARFAGKYLWDIDGQLQGQHHVDNLSLFMRTHYIPDHEIDTIHAMLQARANSPLRFEAECGSCHGDVKEFVEQSIWVRGSAITGMESGVDVSEFLPTHQELKPEDIAFFRKLFARVSGKPIP